MLAQLRRIEIAPSRLLAALSTSSAILQQSIQAGSDEEKAIAQKLAENFKSAVKIAVQDMSGGCGSMYNIELTSPEFKGQSIVKQHQAVHKVLKEDIAQWHGFNLVTKAQECSKMVDLNSDTILGFGLMNKISTGNAILDLILCLFVPVILRSVVPYISQYVNQLWFAHDTKEYTRTIEYVRTSTYWWQSDDDPSNSILQRAVIRYINSKYIEVLAELHSAEFSLRKKPRNETEAAQRTSSKAGHHDDDNKDNQDEETHDYAVNHVPPVDEWVELNDGISFRRSEEDIEDGGKNGKSKNIKFILKCSTKDGNNRIDQFVADALALYKEQESAKVDDSRYLYIPAQLGGSAGSCDGSSSASITYKRYKLSEDKTFQSFFHPEKSDIINLVDQFMNKKGKFAIPGYPQKLGFLLHGPPGTGKTSFIKALSHYTKRNIISIPLAKIRTNQELMDIMFDVKCQVQDQESKVSLGFSKTIFVLEDIDAASPFVKRRAGAALDSPMADMMAIAAAAAIHGPEYGLGTPDKQSTSGKESEITVLGKTDGLNLAGLLNVLDGVVDTPERLVVMTSNHPEELDPALIRPGRINKRIFMDRLCVKEASAMIAHYFGASAVTKTFEERMQQVFIDKVLAPAELEAMCADFENPEALIDNLAATFSAFKGNDDCLI